MLNRLLAVACITLLHSSVLWAQIPGGLFPTLEKIPTIEITRYGPNKLNSYPSIYYIPGSSFDYSDARSNNNTAAATLLFGGMGTALAKAGIDKENSKGVESFATKLPKLDEIVLKLLEASTAKSTNQRFELAKSTADRPRIVLVPHAQLLADKSGLVKVFYYLETTVFNHSGDRVWRNFYAYRPEKTRPIEGPDSWLGEQGSLHADSQHAFGLLMAEFGWDVTGSLDLINREIRFKTCHGGKASPWILLKENPSSIVVRRDLGRTFGPITIISPKEECELAE